MLTSVADIAEQVQKVWAPTFIPELKENDILSTLVNKNFDGEIRQLNDTVYISQIKRAAAQRKTVGAGHESFSSQKLQTARVAIVADQVITASFKMDSLIALQSQLGNPDGEQAIKNALLEGIQIELNNYLYSKVAPKTSAPSHKISGVTNFDGSQLNSIRELASKAKWMKEKGWWLLTSPSYSTDLLNSVTIVSKDYVGDEAPVIGGQVVNKRFGFNILEDNSDGLLSLSPANAGTDCALAFHPDFLHLVMQKAPEIQISSLHSQEQHGYLMSVSIVCGAALGIEGDKKHIQIYNT